jgi:hypothetical protein
MSPAGGQKLGWIMVVRVKWEYYWKLPYVVTSSSVFTSCPFQGSKFTTNWSHMRSKFMACDSFVNASRTVRIEKIAVCATCI